MKMHFIFFVISFLTLCFSEVVAQEERNSVSALSGEETSPDQKHFIHTELGGRTFIFGSLNYEYAVLQNVSVGVGLGMINLQRGEITRSNNGVQEIGSYFDLGTTQMVYGNYFIGGDKHQLLLTAGVTHFFLSYKNKFPSETLKTRNSQILWNAGVGYQYSTKKWYYRLTGYCIQMPQPSGWFPKYMPWGGVSIGYKF